MPDATVDELAGAGPGPEDDAVPGPVLRLWAQIDRRLRSRFSDTETKISVTG